MIEYTEGIYTFYVYILTNKNKTVLYTGVTNNIKLRLHQHENKFNPNSFTARYNAHFLIYYEKSNNLQLTYKSYLLLQFVSVQIIVQHIVFECQVFISL